MFVDWKTTPYKNDAIIKWYERIKLTDSFYNSTELENQKLLFTTINNEEKITHVLIKDDQKNILFKDCKHLFNDYGFLFYDINSKIF